MFGQQHNKSMTKTPVAAVTHMNYAVNELFMISSCHGCLKVTNKTNCVRTK